MPITLRDYQKDAVAATLDQWQQEASAPLALRWGATRQPVLVAMATGTGKSEVGFGLLQAESRAGNLERALIISHTNELVFQPYERIKNDWPGLPTPGVVKAEHNNTDAKIISASIQTLASGNRLDDCLAHGRFSHVWVDETHRVMARTYRHTLERLFETNPDLRLLGTSATPMRSDGQGIGKIFGPAPAFKVTIKDAIYQLGAITSFTAYAARLDLDEHDFSDVRTNAAGDYAPTDTGEILSLPSAHRIIISKWFEVASDRPTIAFTASVAQAHALAAAFRDRGIVALAIDGTTPAQERAEIVEDFRTGAGGLQMLVGCAVFIEGFDAPRASCALIARPTQSDGSYIQMMGRALRWYDKAAGLADDAGHGEAVLIDIVPKGARNLSLAANLMGAPKTERDARSRAEEQGIIMPELFAVPETEGVDAEPDEVYLEVLDLFGTSDLAWFYGAGFASVGIGTEENGSGKKLSLAIAIVMGDDDRLAKAEALRAKGKWQASWDGAYERVAYRVYLMRGNYIELQAIKSSFHEAALVANDIALKRGEGILSQRSKHWRRDTASAGQEKYARQLKIWQDGMTKGQCATAITHKRAQIALERAGIIDRMRVGRE